MAQSRKKRRSKHRGTAAGTIEARGRTGRKPTREEQKASVRADARARRDARLDRPPTWTSAIYRAVFAAVLLFVLTRTGFGGDLSIPSSLLLCLLSMAIYVPLGYATDGWVYRRRQKAKARAAAKPR